MTDNTATETESPTTSGGLDYEKTFGVYAATFRTMIPQIEVVANEHDDLTSQLHIKEGAISEEALETARIRNKSGNPDVTKLNENIRKVEAKLEELKANAHELVQDDVPKPLTEEEAVSVRARVKDLRDQYTKQMEAVKTIAGSVGVSLDDVELPTIMKNGKRVGGGGTGHHGPRIRFSSVFVNGEHVEAKKPNNPNEMTSNFTVAANYITKEVKANPRVTAVDLQKSYFKATGVEPDSDGNLDSSKLPAEQEFTYVYTNPGDKSTTEFVIKAVREV